MLMHLSTEKFINGILYMCHYFEKLKKIYFGVQVPFITFYFHPTGR